MNKLKDMKITKEWLNRRGACETGVEWFSKQKTQRVSMLLNKALKQKQFNFANWAIVRLMTQQQRVQYSCFAAIQSLSIFEKEYPTDKRPRQAIEAALKWALDPSDENKLAAKSAAAAAETAAWSAEAWSAAAWSAAAAARSAEAWSAAESAAAAAWSAEAWSAAWSAAAAQSAAWSTAESAAEAWSAAESAAAAWSAVWKKMLNYGLKLLKGNKNESL